MFSMQVHNKNKYIAITFNLINLQHKLTKAKNVARSWAVVTGDCPVDSRFRPEQHILQPWQPAERIAKRNLIRNEKLVLFKFKIKYIFKR